jgi:hypothetical protein
MFCSRLHCFKTSDDAFRLSYFIAFDWSIPCIVLTLHFQTHLFGPLVYIHVCVYIYTYTHTHIYIYIHTYIHVYILHGFKTSDDTFRLSYSIAFHCSIRPFLDLFHSWLYIFHLSRFSRDGLVFSFLQVSSESIFGSRVRSILST